MSADVDMRDHAVNKSVKTIVREALEEYGGPFATAEGYTGPEPVVLCLLLDSYWYVLWVSCTDIGES
jgi:hypothetical protein